MPIRILVVLAALLFRTFGSAHGAEAPSAVEVRGALARATAYLTSISTEGGYLWRYSQDLDERMGEERATASQIWVQPPGTPAVGTAFLEAYRATGDAVHWQAAEKAALALVRGQLRSGGWDYLVDFDPANRHRWAYRVDVNSGEGRGAAPGKNVTIFDDDNTQSALRFLLAFQEAGTAAGDSDSSSLRTIGEALDYGVARMIDAQYANGAWPQRWNGRPHELTPAALRPASIPTNWPTEWPRADYSGFFTLNDRAQLDCIETMLEVHRYCGDEACLAAAKRGGDFLILAQLPEPQPGWAQQYNFGMEPAWARAFEPPAVCSSESATAMRTLVNLYVQTGDRRFLQPIPPFLEWLDRSQLGPDRWARLYELGSNRPLYGDRDGRLHYTLAEVSAERQRGYAWEGSFGIPEARRYYEAVQAKGREAVLPLVLGGKDRPTPGSSRVARILSEQDARGRWLFNGWVDMRGFTVNMSLLSSYLEALEAAPHGPTPFRKGRVRVESGEPGR